MLVISNPLLTKRPKKTKQKRKEKKLLVMSQTATFQELCAFLHVFTGLEQAKDVRSKHTGFGDGGLLGCNDPILIWDTGLMSTKKQISDYI